MANHFTRRDAIRAGLVAGAGLMTSSVFAHEWSDASRATKPNRTGALRFAHLTDMHVQPELRGGEGYAAALQSLNKLDPKPQFVVLGGDHVMDTTEHSHQRAIVQWDLFDKVMRENCPLPVHHVLGNHDVAGWGAKEGFDSTMPGYGKAMAIERFKIPNLNYAFDAGGWRFIILDSIAQREKSYYGWLGEDQNKWLSDELAHTGTKKPICIVSHLPVMSVCAYFDGDRLQENNWQVPDSFIHRDMPAITKLIEPYNVRLLLSGHLHLVDRCEYRGKTYICDGAVCGNWWKGAYHDCPEGYGVIDIWPDGTFEHQYVPYGWKADVKSE